MQKSQRARQPEPERTSDALAPKSTQRKEQVQRSSEPQRFSLYEQVVGNRVPPRLRLSASPHASDKLPVPRSVEEVVPQREPLVPVLGEERSPGQRREALRAQLWGQGVPPHLRLSPPVQRKENTTGLPDRLKEGVENLSGLSLDDVQVQYHSSKPAEVQALAYTQGTEIYVGPGQEQYLSHEAWHVVQQKQGRVQPIVQAKGVAINDDLGLEREADRMGVKALQREKTGGRNTDSLNLSSFLAIPQGEVTQLQDVSTIVHRASNHVIQCTYQQVLNAEAEERAMAYFWRMVQSHLMRESNQKRIYALREEQKETIKQLQALPQSEQRDKKIERERKKFTGILEEVVLRKGNADEDYNHAYQVLNRWFKDATTRDLTHEEVKSIAEKDVTKQHPLAQSFIKGAKQNYQTEGTKRFDDARAQKNLILGSRTEVADLKKPTQILNTNIWSWGVNQAFVEGGAASGATFQIYTDIGDEAKELLSQKHMDGAAFLKAIAPTDDAPKGMNRNLWYSGAGSSPRPTWYALELAGLLDIGYRLNRARTHMELPPQKVGTVSQSTQDRGIDAYLRTEGIR